MEPAAKSAYGRQRFDGSRPSGNTNAIASGHAKKTGHSEATSAAHDPPGSDPGCASSATHAYGVAASTAASDSAPEDEDPTDRVARPPRCNQRADGGRRRDGSDEERVQPVGPGPWNVLLGSDPIQHQPAGDQGYGRKREPPGNQTRCNRHSPSLVER